MYDMRPVHSKLYPKSSKKTLVDNYYNRQGTMNSTGGFGEYRRQGSRKSLGKGFQTDANWNRSS